jgi:hypothetical protein
MPAPVLYKYLDFGERAMADLSLRSGERVFLSIVPRGFAVHRTHLRGLVPGRRLFIADAEVAERLTRVVTRDAAMLPPLPQATQRHRDESAMVELLEAATADLTAVADSRPVPGHVDAFDPENRPERPLSLFTRLALTAADGADLARRFERAANTPG